VTIADNPSRTSAQWAIFDQSAGVESDSLNVDLLQARYSKLFKKLTRRAEVVTCRHHPHPALAFEHSQFIKVLKVALDVGVCQIG